MKNIRIIIGVVFLFLLTSIVNSQNPNPPGDGNGGTSGAPGPVGGGAPVGSGVISLLILATGYGMKKMNMIEFSKRR